MSTKPEPPRYLKIFPMDGEKVRLIWNQSPSEDILEYRIYIGKQGKIDYSTPVAIVNSDRQGWTSGVAILEIAQQHRANIEVTEREKDAVAGLKYGFNVRSTSKNNIEDENQLLISIPYFINYYSTETCNVLEMNKNGDILVGTAGGLLIYYNRATAWKRYRIEEGLASNKIYSLLVDSSGILWVGTDDGLSRYNGKVWKTYKKKDGLADNLIHSIFEDSNKTLWFGTDNGLTEYDGKSWKTYSTSDGLSGNVVLSIIEDNSKILWFGTDNGLTRYDRKRWNRYYETDGLAGNTVFSLFVDSSGTLWVGTSNGLSRYTGKKWKTYSERDGLAGNWIHAILEESPGILWVGTDNGVSRYNGMVWKTYRKEDGLPDNRVYSIIRDITGTIWIGTYYGLSKYDGQEWKYHKIEDDLAGSRVYSMIEDSFGRLWFGTYKGLSRYDDKTWKTYREEDGLSCNLVHSILVDSSGVLWIGTENGLSRYDGEWWKTFDERYGLGSNLIYSVIEDRQGILWVGTENGLTRYDDKIWKTYHERDGLVDNRVYALLEDSEGMLWIGTADGLSRYDGKTFKGYHEEDGLSDNRIYTIFEDKSKALWIGTDNGLTKYDGKEFKIYRREDGIGGNCVYSIMEDSCGILWVGTDNGLSRYDGEIWITYTVENGLAHNWVHSIMEDSSGILWFGTRNGLSKLETIPVLYKNYLQDVSKVYPVIYSLFKDFIYPAPILMGLNKLFIENESISNIFFTYQRLISKDEEKAEALELAVDTFSKTVDFDYGRGIYDLYSLIYSAFTTKNISQIVALGYEFSKCLENISHLEELIPNISDVMKKVNGVIDVLNKSDRLGEPDEKIPYFITSINLLENLHKQVENAILEPEKGVLLDTVANWRKIVDKAIKDLAGRPKITVILKTKEIVFKEEVNILFALTNISRTHAEDLRVELLPSSDYQIINGVKDIGLLVKGRSTQADFLIKPIAKKIVKFTILVSYQEPDATQREFEYSDEVRFIDERVEFKEILWNPYVTGKPLTPGEHRTFFGREDVFKFINSSLSGDNIILLVGDRRTGKSSILKHLDEKLYSDYFIPVYFDLQQDIGTYGKFFRNLSWEITRALKKKGIMIELPPLDQFEKDTMFTFKNVFLEEVNQSTDKRLLILLDEFEELENKVIKGKLDEGIFGEIRHLMQHSKLSFILAGTHRLDELTKDYWSTLFNIALYREISFLDEESAEKLIKEPVKDYMEYDDLAVERLMKVTACYPYFLQLFCFHLVNLHNEKKVVYIGVEDINEVVDKVVESGEAHFRYIYDNSSTNEKIILSALCEALTLTPQVTISDIINLLNERMVVIDIHEVKNCIDMLEKRRVIKSDGSICNFKIDLLRSWVEKKAPLSRIIGE